VLIAEQNNSISVVMVSTDTATNATSTQEAMTEHASRTTEVLRSSRIAKRLKLSLSDSDRTERCDDGPGKVSPCCASNGKSASLEDDSLLRNIFSFVGDYQYRFVGGVNRAFQKSYVSLHPHKQTHCNASTVAHAKIGWNDIATNSSYDDTKKDKLQRNLWHSAARYGSKASVTYLCKRVPPAHVFHVLKVQSVKGKKPKRIYLEDDWRYDLCYKAAEYGQLELLRWVYDKYIFVSTDDQRVIEYAIGNGHIDVVQWAMSSGFDWDDCVCAGFTAAENGHLEALQWIHIYASDIAESDVWGEACWGNHAAKGGHIGVLHWLQSIGAYIGKSTIDHAIQYGQLETLQYLLDTECPRWENLCHIAALCGQLPILQLLRSNDFELDEFVLAYAAVSGSKDIIEWATENGCPFSESACQYAASYGSLDTLKWLRAKGFPWNEATTEYASTEEIYNWAKVNGCPVAKGNPRNEQYSNFIDFYAM
jgi:hypothetical protein